MSHATYSRALVALAIVLTIAPFVLPYESRVFECLYLAMLVLLAVSHVSRVRAIEERVFVVAVLKRHRGEWLPPMQIVTEAKGTVSESIVDAVLADLEDEKIVSRRMQLERWEDGIMSGVRCPHYQLREGERDGVA